MASITINNHPVLSGSVRLPLSGAWEAKLEVEADSLPELTGQVSIVLGSSTLIGTVIRGGTDQGRANVWVLGGKGRIGVTVPARSYQATVLDLLLGQLAEDCGEVFSSSILSDVRSYPVRRWTRPAGSAARCLEELAAIGGWSWRLLADGSIWVGLETWPESALDADTVERDPTHGTVGIASEDPKVWPGETFQGSRVVEVVHRIEPGVLRTSIVFQSGSAFDRLRGAFEGIVRVLTSRYDYHGLYRCRVVVQRADGSLDLQPEGNRFPPISAVPIRLGLPGFSVEIEKGAIVLLGWEDGDPRKPIANLWDSASVKRLTFNGQELQLYGNKITIGQQGQQGAPASGVGDLVDVVLPPLMPVAGQITIAGVPSPFTGFLTVADSAIGVITSGSERVFITK